MTNLYIIVFFLLLIIKNGSKAPLPEADHFSIILNSYILSGQTSLSLSLPLPLSLSLSLSIYIYMCVCVCVCVCVFVCVCVCVCVYYL